MLTGNGTAEQPYLIQEPADLCQINNDLSAYFVLARDIALTGEFEPIANQFEPFTGTFDGANHRIEGLCIKTKTQYVGLFANNMGTIKNLVVAHSEILATAYVGGIAGYNGGVIEGCSTSGTIVGTSMVGGIAGLSDENGVERENHSSCVIMSTDPYFAKGKPATALFVAPNGSDENEGSKEFPLKTIAAAVQKLGEILRRGSRGDSTVWIRGGDYYVEEPIQLTKELGFAGRHRVGFYVYPGEKANLIGGIPVLTWEPHQGSIQKAYVGEIRCKYLSVDGKLRMPAQTAQWRDLRFDLSNVYGYFSHGWFSEILKVTEIKKGEVNTAIPKSAFSHEANHLMGAIEFIKEDGDWAIGNDGYVYCKNGESHEVIVPAVKDIFYLDGAKNVIISGLNLAVTDMGENFTAQGGRGKEGFDAPENTHAAIFLNNSKACTIRDNQIENCGLNGVSLQGGSTDNSIVSNSISNIGFTGIHCNGNWIDSIAYNNKHNLIKNNTIHGVGMFAVNGAGIYILGSGHNHVCNNLIHDTPRYGISMKGARYYCWQLDCGRNMDNEISFDEHFDYLHSRNNLIEANHIYNTGKNSLDGGGIEAWGIGRYNVIDYNLIYNFYNGIPTTNWKGHGIFLDDATHYTTVTNNIVYESNRQGADASTFMKSIAVYVRNNIFDVTNTHQGAANISPYLDPCKNQTFTNNIVYADPKGGIGEDGQFVEHGSLDRRIYTYDLTAANSQSDSPIRYLDRNLYFNTGGGLVVSMDNGNPSADIAWPKFVNETGFDQESICADPLFVDAVHRNYQLQPDSPAFKLGFKNINMSKIGLVHR